MKIFLIIKLVPLLIYTGIIGLLHKNKSREINYKKVQHLSRMLIKWLGYNLTVNKKEHTAYNGPVLFFSNHQGTIDPAIIIAACDIPISFVSKKENEKLPFLGQWGKNIGTIYFSREKREDNIAMIRKVLKALRNNQSVLLFPEGTRSKSDNLNKFKPHSLQLAFLSKADVVVVSLSNAYCFDVNKKNKNIKVVFSEVLKYDDYKDLSYDEFENIVFTKMKEGIILG